VCCFFREIVIDPMTQTRSFDDDLVWEARIQREEEANGSVLLRVRGSNRAESEGRRSSGEGVEEGVEAYELKADAIDPFGGL
jgi:hypothetical protein